MAVYTGTLTDVGVSSLSTLSPRLTVRPEVEAFGPSGVVTDNRKVVPITGSSFSMDLIPSHQLSAPGRVGVKYILEVVLSAESADGKQTEVWRSHWVFTALGGGGSISGMGDVPALGFFAGPPWPTERIPGVYFDVPSADLGYYQMEE